MKKLLALFCGFIFLVACKKTDDGKKIISEKDMVNVLIDMHLVDASLDYSGSVDSTLMKAKSKYNYIFSKYKIDSTEFSNSINYYSIKDNQAFVKIYAKVTDSLNNLTTKLANAENEYYLPINQHYPSDIYYHFQIPFKIDSSLLVKEKPVVANTINLKKDTLSSKIDTVVKAVQEKEKPKGLTKKERIRQSNKN